MLNEVLKNDEPSGKIKAKIKNLPKVTNGKISTMVGLLADAHNTLTSTMALADMASINTGVVSAMLDTIVELARDISHEYRELAGAYSSTACSLNDYYLAREEYSSKGEDTAA